MQRSKTGSAGFYLWVSICKNKSRTDYVRYNKYYVLNYVLLYRNYYRFNQYILVPVRYDKCLLVGMRNILFRKGSLTCARKALDIADDTNLFLIEKLFFGSLAKGFFSYALRFILLHFRFVLCLTIAKAFHEPGVASQRGLPRDPLLLY